jgi:large subunit ribosomal protein L21
MYAIIAHGNQQYKVETDQVLEIDLDEGDPGSELTFDRVLAVSDDGGFRLGQPTLAGASVTAKVIGIVQADKVYIQKIRRRKNYRRRTGHRQQYLKVQIAAING